MEYTLGPAQVDLEEIDKDPKRLARKLTALIREREQAFEKHRGEEITRNLSYYRGHFWSGDGHGYPSKTRSYRAEQNEVFPIIDTIKSALAMDLPQVEAIPQRISSFTEQNRETDPSIRGRRVSAVLNWMANEDSMDEEVQELVLHALLFPMAIIKISWSASLGRVIWRTRMPWEVFFDSNARRISEASYAFERFTVHWDTFQSRRKSGAYKLTPGAGVVTPNAYPRSLLQRWQTTKDDDYERKLREAGLKEYVSLVEFWDFRKGVFHHIHVDTGQILMTTKIPYGRPYEVLVFHPGIGRIEGIPDTTLIAPIQRDLNELVSARREMVSRLVRRLIVDRNLFQDERDWSRFKNSRAWEPTRVNFPPNAKIQDHFFVTPEMGTTMDYNAHLMDSRDAIRRTVGEADHQRGVVKNIRTAAEVDAIRSSIEGRMNVRVRRLTKIVSRMFDRSLDVLRWALHNPAASQIDINRITERTQEDVPSDILRHDILLYSEQFRLLPFSPLMEDRVTRRQYLVELLQQVANPEEMASVIDSREFVREIVELFGLRPSILKPEEEQVAEDQMVAAETAKAVPEGATPNGVPQEMLAGLAAQMPTPEG